MNVDTWGEWGILILLASALLLSAHEHGKTKVEKKNFFSMVFSVAIMFTFCWGAGLFH